MRSDDIVNVMYRENFLRFSQSACVQRFFNSEKAMQGNKIRRQIAFAELRSATSSVGSRRKKLLDDHVNDGNFRALLRMRISCGDTNLKEHVENTPLNAKYFSPEILNNIIKICGIIIQDDLVKKTNDAKCFADLVDSTTDISVTEQILLCVRYVTQGDRSFSLREDFLELFPIKTATGRNLGNHILNALSSLGVNCTNLCGQGYDWASSMSGCFNGVQIVIKETNPTALYVHWKPHSLKLALMRASNVPAIRNYLGTVKSVITQIAILVCKKK
ncbi:Zinc finger MYM-type protein 1 [Araneus ventricosus]|uniref:Zinc finger MYM-type protein 1 n=1 Tax=Araneus ventricosus TaxID=182803 RepID=A0A4Y1ZPR0_ARAVE|nr:Zinc finger MYM-type protein 1 [Araneus ventricosus]